MKHNNINNGENIIRLMYINMRPYYNIDQVSLAKHFIVTSPLILPEGMNLEEACKFISYLTDKAEKENNGKKEAQKTC